MRNFSTVTCELGAYSLYQKHFLMKARTILAISSLLFAVACSSGGYKVVGSYDPTQQAFSGVVMPDNPDSGKGCPPLPETFKESDMVGIWGYFGIGPGGVMTITIQADGTYRQIYDYPYTGYHYEGDWRHWELERRENGTALIHFQDMPICGETCKPFFSGVIVDSCEQYKRIPIKDNEVALILLGSPPPNDPKLSPDSPVIALRGIEMLDPALDPDSAGILYRLKR
jgi:hypothetical protein